VQVRVLLDGQLFITAGLVDDDLFHVGRYFWLVAKNIIATESTEEHEKTRSNKI
jgi:hypothetical protein